MLLSVAFMTLAERKVMASMQRRVGPNVWGFCGVLQPFLDGLKLFVKEPVFPANADQPLFVWAPMFTFIVSQIGWSVIPAEQGIVLSDVNLGVMYLLSVSSLGVYGIMIAGWSSNSKYAFLGCCRSVAQMISYELPMGIILMTVCLIAGSLNISEIILCQKNIWFGIPLFPLMIMWFICCLAETNRAPFDLPEARVLVSFNKDHYMLKFLFYEAELVAGYNVEYSSMGFALFFIAEYTNMLLMSTLCALFFLGGTQAPLSFLSTVLPIPGSFWLALKMTLFLFLFVWVRATLPRYRYDQLMRLGWKVFLPLSLGFFLVTAVLVLSFETWPLATL
nr:NADH dehydrogenase subunit 1 [Oedogonium sp. 260_circle1_72169]